MRLGTTVLRPARHVASMRVLVTDPCLVRSPDEYASGITEGVAGTPASLQPGTYVPVPVTPSFLAALKAQKSRLMHSRSGFESYWSLGRPVDDLTSLVYLGAHGSDSGLTALVPEDPFADPAAEPVDWPEFVLSTLDVAEGGADELDDYPLYKFFGRIPDEASEAAVYGLPVAAGAGVYEAIVVRALAAVLPGASDPADACD